MMELEPITLATAAALRIPEGALVPVALVNGAAHGGWRVARPASSVRVGQALSWRARLPEAAGLEPFELLADGRLDHRSQVATGQLEAHQGLKPLELVA
jgi:hypothetical protein